MLLNTREIKKEIYEQGYDVNHELHMLASYDARSRSGKNERNYFFPCEILPLNYKWY